MIHTTLIVRDPEIMSGTPVFAGTRVPIRNLFDYLEGGDTLDEFLDDFPTVTRSHAVAVLELCSEIVVSQVSPPVE
ncbi:MAG TPA: DUF433 domain-containing protein [Chloroflexia bacterium]|jgi:uncharacterized protein (DUF433 family)